MGDSIIKIFAIILVVILLFIFPLLSSFERMDDLSYMVVYSATAEFVDTVRNTGVITPEAYRTLKRKLNSTGNKYKVEMVHRKAVYDNNNNNMLNYSEENVDNEKNIPPTYTEIYTEGILIYMGNTGLDYNDDLIYRNYSNFSEDDYFYVSIKNISTTPASVIKNTLFGQSTNNYSVMFSYGGLINNISYLELAQ